MQGLQGLHLGTRDVGTLARRLFVALVVLAVLLEASQYSYLLYHSLAETFSVIIGCGVFMVGWNTRRFHNNSYLTFLSISLAFVAGMDLVHMLSFKGMGVFPGPMGTDPPTQLWVSARMVHAISLIIAALLLDRRLRAWLVILGYAVGCSLLAASILVWRVFPSCHDGLALTPFKKAAEVVICIMLLISMALLLRRRERFDVRFVRLMVLAIGLTVAQEIAFMLYGSVQDTANFVGHVLKILAFYFLYRAIVETGLAKPFDLLFRDLSRAKEAAEAASRAKDQFLAMLSHELRTPLTPIRLAVEFLEPRTDLPPDVVRELAMIRRNVDLEAKLIEDLLDLTRVARGELRLELAPANAHELVRIALGIGDRQPGPPITEKLEASAACIHGDPTRLQQVFWNLFSNARKYTPAHGSIVVRSYNDDGQWVLEVSDSGEGISPELLPRIFDAFEQGGPQRGRKYGGLGLGLAISKAIVEAHSGQISAYSPGPGSGASFCVRLPLSRMPHIPAEPLQPAAQHVGN